MKRCSRCEQNLPLDAFTRNRNGRDGLAWACRECMKLTRDIWRAANPERVRASARKQNYGITQDEFDAILDAQGGVCAICRNEPYISAPRLQVDHDHKCCPSGSKGCGKCVRGILCQRCNLRLGKCRDFPSEDIWPEGRAYIDRYLSRRYTHF